jgi:hypothetical protein
LADTLDYLSTLDAISGFAFSKETTVTMSAEQQPLMKKFTNVETEHGTANLQTFLRREERSFRGQTVIVEHWRVRVQATQRSVVAAVAVPAFLVRTKSAENQQQYEENSLQAAMRDARTYANKHQVEVAVFQNSEGTYLHREAKYLEPTVTAKLVVKPEVKRRGKK